MILTEVQKMKRKKFIDFRKLNPILEKDATKLDLPLFVTKYSQN